jgi:hypothetical protein
MAGTAIRRSIIKTIGAAALSLAFVFFAYTAFDSGNFWWAIGLACVAVAAAVGAVVGPKTASCPHCGRAITPEADKTWFNHCRACGEYSQQQGNTMVKLPPDYIHMPDGIRFANFPVALAYVTNKPSYQRYWPNICIICNAPATRTEPSVDVVIVTPEIDHRLSFPFPRCEGCVVSVQKDDHHEIWYGPGFRCDSHFLWFDSYRFWREFCRLNGIDPRWADSAAYAR